MNVSEMFDWVKKTVLKSGKHTSLSDGMCAMEFASFLAKEPFSDSPSCVDPTIRAYIITWNDVFPDAV